MFANNHGKKGDHMSIPVDDHFVADKQDTFGTGPFSVPEKKTVMHVMQFKKNIYLENLNLL